MGKRVPDANLDDALDQVGATATTIHFLTDEPANYAGIAALELASATISGSITKANGDVSGRKATIPAQTGVSISTSGDSDHVALSNGTDKLWAVTTHTLQALTSGGTVDSAAFDIEIPDAA